MKTKIHGLGFGGWLALIFITLKLCKVIAWSWLWVLAPLWVPIGISLAAIVVLFAFTGLTVLVAWIIARRCRK